MVKGTIYMVLYFPLYMEVECWQASGYDNPYADWNMKVSIVLQLVGQTCESKLCKYESDESTQYCEDDLSIFLTTCYSAYKILIVLWLL
jgi:hypothetical protein